MSKALPGNDPDLAIAWPVPDPVLSDKDATNPTLREFLDASTS